MLFLFKHLEDYVKAVLRNQRLLVVYNGRAGRWEFTLHLGVQSYLSSAREKEDTLHKDDRQGKV